MKVSQSVAMLKVDSSHSILAVDVDFLFSFYSVPTSNAETKERRLLSFSCRLFLLAVHFV